MFTTLRIKPALTGSRVWRKNHIYNIQGNVWQQYGIRMIHYLQYNYITDNKNTASTHAIQSSSLLFVNATMKLPRPKSFTPLVYTEVKRSTIAN